MTCATSSDAKDRGQGDLRRRLVLGARDAGMRARIARALRHEGYEVLEFRHAVEITKHLMETALDPDGRDAQVLISDVAIPGATPLEILEYLRTLDPATPLILLVERAEPLTRTGAQRLGAALIEPPFDGPKLVRAVREAFDERRSREMAMAEDATVPR
jgi:two-component system C4-dicarboxylate transport response regulator DctD